MRLRQILIDVAILVILASAPIYPTHILYFGGFRGSEDTYQSLLGILSRWSRPVTDIYYERPAWFIWVYPALFIAAAFISRRLRTKTPT
jgi:hypothetical protein